MNREYLMGNGAIALGALKAGVKVCAGYPGTPSSEIIENIVKYKSPEVYAEWSVNEKAALEVAAAAAYSGARTLVTMKQVGLNVASDPLMSLAYVGVKGGMVVVVADDPGPISSQTEQDTRVFAEYARIPVFDPSSPEEAFEMIQQAFDCSEKYRTPVIFRPTTRVCHAYASVEFDGAEPRSYEGFVKDSKKWVIFPRLSFMNHELIEKRNPEIAEDFSDSGLNFAHGSGKKAVFASGVSWAYAKEFLQNREDVVLAKISTPHPFPEKFALSVLEKVEEALCFEELSPYLEQNLLKIAGKHHLPVKIFGKTTGNGKLSGENSADIAEEIIGGFLGDKTAEKREFSDMPKLPVRPPVLCAGCPHRASFYAVKTAMSGKKAIFCGDIGCYTLGNAMPLDMTDTCLCMGAGITMAQGFGRVEKDATCFAFVGDSTFFASGMTGVVNAVYNRADMILCVLDNSTTAMTGHQPHPGTGKNLMDDITSRVDLTKVLEGIGVAKIVTVDPLDLDNAVKTVKECAALDGVKAIIFKSPCIAVEKSAKKMTVDESCVMCETCINEIGCPALSAGGEGISIDATLCTGCGLCAQICPVSAIKLVGGDANG